MEGEGRRGNIQMFEVTGGRRAGTEGYRQGLRGRLIWGTEVQVYNASLPGWAGNVDLGLGSQALCSIDEAYCRSDFTIDSIRGVVPLTSA